MPFVNHFISLPLDLHTELAEIARQRGISLSDILFESLLNAAEDHRPLLGLGSMPYPFIQDAERLCA